MQLRRSFFSREILSCLRRHAPHEVALSGGIAVAVVFVGLPKRKFELFIFGSQAGAKGKTVAKEHLVGVPCNPGRR